MSDDNTYEDLLTSVEDFEKLKSLTDKQLTGFPQAALGLKINQHAVFVPVNFETKHLKLEGVSYGSQLLEPIQISLVLGFRDLNKAASVFKAFAKRCSIAKNYRPKLCFSKSFSVYSGEGQMETLYFDSAQINIGVYTNDEVDEVYSFLLDVFDLPKVEAANGSA